MNTNNASGKPRYLHPERHQLQFRDICLDELISPTHEARSILKYVQCLDLSSFDEGRKAVEGAKGRDAIPPAILLTVWLMATLEGISSGRHLSDRCKRDAVYMWICGGISISYNVLNEFRTKYRENLEQLMVETITVLHDNKLIDFKRVSQDGMRVRANAGKSSFHKRDKLEALYEEAKEHVSEVMAEGDRDQSAQQQAAQIHAAQDREQRLAKALEEHEKLAAQREKRKKGDGEKTRTSTTDPEARNMKMADGGYRSAFNVQAATTNDTRIVVGVDVTNEGTDSGQLEPMLDQIESNFGVRPEEILADGGFNSKEDVTRTEQSGTKVYSPPRKPRKQGQDPFARHKGDSDEVFHWRQRMKTPEAQEIYKERCSTAEFPFARFRNQGLQQFPVRTMDRAKSVTLLHALAHNFRQILHFGWLQAFTNS